MISRFDDPACSLDRDAESRRWAKRLALFILSISLTVPRLASACAVCFGEAETPQTIGAGLAIVFLLGLVAVMLAAFASFFIYLRRRARAFAESD